MRKLFLALTMLFLINGISYAKVFTFTIANPNYKPIRIGLWGFKHTKSDNVTVSKLQRTILRDLDISGLFSTDRTQHFSYEAPSKVVVGLGKIDNLNYVLYGNAFRDGKNMYLSVKMVDVAKGVVFFDHSYYSNIKSFSWIGNIVVDELMNYVTGTYGPFESKIVFAKGRGKVRDIYICDFNGENIERLTNWHTMNILPKWIDRQTISFLSYRYGKPSIFIFNLYKGRVKRLFYKSSLSISAVRFGYNKFAIPFDKNGNVDIYLVNSKGKVLRNLTNSFGIDVSPTFTNDYSRMIFVSNRTGSPQIYIKDLNNFGTTTRLTYNGNYNSSPALSPDNKKIAYIAIDKGRVYLRVMNIDGSDDKAIMTGYNLDSPSWSYDSRFVAVSAEINGKKGIYIVNTLNNHYSIATGDNNMYNGLSVSEKIQ